jgi:hypothetical protein
MSHGATITIWNNTDFDMRKATDKICHGKYSDNVPPMEIKNKTKGTFRVSPESGGSIGPKGWVDYSMAVKGQVDTIRIFWDHPVGSKASRYKIHSVPFEIAYVLEPQTPTGTEQTVSIMLEGVLDHGEATPVTIDCEH